jgi:hypothetical protein
MTAVGLPKGIHSGYLARNNLWTDPDLGVDHAVVRRIPYPCLACQNQLSKAWQPNIEAILQDHYRQNQKCRLWNVFLGLNNWLIVDLRPTATINLDEVQEACYNVIKGLCRQMGEEIGIGQIGEFTTDDTATLGYYLLVLFTSNAFSVDPENIIEAASDDTQQIEEGSLVVRGQFYFANERRSFLVRTTK